MIRQTCQRCGHSFNPQAVISPAYERDQEDVVIYIGEWSRNYILCGECASQLVAKLDLFMDREHLKKEVLDEVVAQQPYANRADDDAWCYRCNHWKRECVCKKLANEDD